MEHLEVFSTRTGLPGSLAWPVPTCCFSYPLIVKRGWGMQLCSDKEVSSLGRDSAPLRGGIPSFLSFWTFIYYRLLVGLEGVWGEDFLFQNSYKQLSMPCVEHMIQQRYISVGVALLVLASRCCELWVPLPGGSCSCHTEVFTKYLKTTPSSYLVWGQGGFWPPAWETGYSRWSQTLFWGSSRCFHVLRGKGLCFLLYTFPRRLRANGSFCFFAPQPWYFKGS